MKSVDPRIEAKKIMSQSVLAVAHALLMGK